jgi:hypothetical protein
VWRVRFRDSYGKQTCETLFDNDMAKKLCGLLGVLNPEEALVYMFRRADDSRGEPEKTQSLADRIAASWWPQRTRQVRTLPCG